MWSPPTQKITIVAATLRLDEQSPIKTIQRTETIHEHLENWMGLTDAKPHISSLQNPENILNKRALVCGLYPYLVKLVNAQRNGIAERSLEGEDVTMQPVIRAQIGRDQEQWRRKKPEKPLAQSCIYLLPRHSANPPNEKS
jgi:hypothetical protein